jgi:hypothetical protein
MALISVGQLSIVDANDGLSAQLTSNSIVLPADAAGNVNSYAGAETSFTIYEGGVDMSSKWGYFVSATGGGVTYRDINDAVNRSDTGPTNGVLDSNYLKVTSLTQSLSWIDITATRAQQQNIVRRYSIAKANTGATGTRGTLTATRAIAGGVWVDADAATAIAGIGGGSPINGDIVTLFRASPVFSETRVFNGTAWITMAAYLAGSQIIDGSVSGGKLIAQSITATQIAGSTITANQIAGSTITANQLAANTITAAKIAGNTITAAQIAGNTITAAQIAANTISTSRLAVSDFTNYAANGDLSLGNVNWSNLVITDATNAYNGTNVIALPPAASARYASNDNVFSVKGGDQFYLEWWGKAGSDMDSNFNVYLRVNNAAGAQVQTINVGSINAAQKVYTLVSGSATITATGYTAYLQINYNNTVGTGYIGLVRLRRKNEGSLIVDGAISANQLSALAVTTDKLAAGAVTADKLTANSVTANKLTLLSRPISTIGINMRVNASGSMDWDAGQIRTIDAAGAMISYSVTAASNVAYNGSTIYFFFMPGRTGIDYNNDPANLINPGYIPLAVWKGASDLTVMSGVGTSINGDQIVVGSISANKIKANSITANEIAGGTITGDKLVAGTITAAQIAAGAIVASKLAIGNSDNIVPDSDMRDVTFWIGDTPTALVYQGDQNGGWPFSRYLRFNTTGGAFRYSGRPFPVEPGATYKIKLGIYIGGSTANTWFNPLINVPYVSNMSLKSGANVATPAAADATNGYVGNVDSRSTEFIFTNPTGITDNANRLLRFEFYGDLQGAYVEFMVSMVRVSDNTLIQDGAITTTKITVNSLNGDRIKVGTLDADRISATSVLSNTITVSGASTLANAFTSATWAGVSGTGKPADNATVGAPAGTYVGTQLAQDMVTDVANAKAAVGQIANDNVLSINEKSDIIREWNRIDSSRTNLGARLAALGLSRAAIDTAYTALQSYLVSLTPAWSDVTLNTPIVGATFRQKFQDYYAQETAAISNATATAATTSAWAGVTGTGKPADGATVGAPVGTSVAGMPAQDIVNSVTAATSDNILSPAEKPMIWAEWQRVLREEASLYTRGTEYVTGGKAARYDVQTKRDAASTAKTNLSNYINTFSPALTSFETTTAVNGASLRDLFYAYYDKVEPFKVALQYLASESGDWALVTGAGKAADNATVGAPSGTNVGSTLAQTIESRANNPAATVNANVTTIDPGKILISGSTTLSSWRNGGDNTKIEGGSIAANTISANKITVGSRGLSFEGINFEVKAVPTSAQELTWSGGYIQYVNDAGTGVAILIAAGNTLGVTKRCFVYWTKGEAALRVATSAEPIMADQNSVMIGTYYGGTTFNMTYGSTIINGDRITTGSITANQIAANTITAGQIAAGSITANELSVGGSVEGLLMNGGAETGTTEGWTGQGFVLAGGNGSAYNHGQNPNSGNGYSSKAFPVTAGRTYTFNYDLYGTNAYFRIMWAAAKPAFNTPNNGQVDLLANGGSGSFWQSYTGAWTAPNGANWVSIVLYNTGTSNAIYWDNIQVFEQVSGVRIKNGAITADKIAVGSLSAINANIGEVTAGTIRNASGTTNLNLNNGDFTFDINSFKLNSPGNVITNPFEYSNGALRMKNVVIDGGTIANVTISTSKIIGNSVTTNAYYTIDSGGSMGGFPQNTFVDFNTTSYGGGGSDGGGGGGSGGGGGACPVLNTPILLANSERDGPGEIIMAGDLKADHDWVWTQHGTTKEWGAFRVTYARVVQDVVVHEVTIDGNMLTASWDHPVWVDGRWETMAALSDTCGRADVMRITIDDAHTYISNGILSHNKVVNQQQV